MANSPPPFNEITGTSAIVGKYNQQENIANVDGNARPGQLIVDLDTDPPQLYIGNNNGNISLVASGGGNASLPLSNGTSVFNIPVASGNVTITSNGSYTWNFDKTGNLTLPGNIRITGNIIPSSDITYDLGNSTNRWKDLYLSGQTIYIGDQTISSNTTNVIFSGIISANANGLTNIPAANIVGNAGSNFTANYSNYAGNLINGTSNVDIATSGGNVKITSNSAYSWTFDRTGNLVLPANSFNVNYANGTQVSLGGGGSNISNGTSNVNIATSGGNVTTGVAGTTKLTVTSTGANIAGTLSVSGNSNVGNIGATNGVFTTVAGSLTTASQPNITSTGTLSSLSVSGTSNLGPVSNVTITGGSNGQVLTTDGSNVLSWTTVATGSSSNISNGTSNVSIATSGGNVTTSVGGNANIIVVTGTGANINGTLSISGNANVGNISTDGVGGNIDGANVISANTFSASGNLISTGLTDLGAVSNVTITGGSTGQYLQTDGSGVLSFATISTSGISNGNSNVDIATSNGNVSITSGGTYTWTFDDSGDIRGTGANSYLNLGDSGDDLITLKSNPDVGLTLFSTSAALLGNSNVDITANTGANSLTWRFDDTGNLTLPTNNLNIKYANGQQVQLGASSNISNGLSNVNIATNSGDVTTTVDGNTVLTVTDLGVNIDGTLSVSGNANVGNISTDGLGGNIDGANVISANTFIASGNLISNGLANLGPVANVIITGGSTGQYLQTDGTGVLTWSTVDTGSSSNISNGTSNVNIATTNGNVITSVAGTTRLSVNTGGANITGTLSVSGNSNVGNIGATSGVFTTVAGSLTTQAQPNITSTGTLTSLSVSGNSNIGNIGTGGLITATGNISGANINTGGLITATGNVTGANLTTGGVVSATGNITGANINTAGTVTASRLVSNIATGTAPFTVTSTTQVANLNVATAGAATTAGTVTTNAQPNITSTGTLTTLSVSGNSNVGNIGAAGGVFTTVAGSLTTAAQPNVTSTGVLTSLSVSGNANIGNIGTGGLITSTGNISGANLTTGGLITATGNITGANINTSGTVTASRLVSNIATGTAPFTVTSTTQVANLNVATAGTAGTVTTNAQPNITSTGILTTLSVSGNSNVGNIGAAAGVFTTVAGTLTTAAQPNITSTGTLSSLSVTGNTTTANLIANSYVFAPAIVSNGSTTDTRIELGSVTGIIAITSAGNSTQFKPGGQVELGGASQIIGGTFGGSGITVAGTQTDIFQNRGGNVTVQLGTGGSISNTWSFIQDGSFTSPGAVSATGNVIGGNLTTGGILNVTGTNVSSIAGNVNMNGKWLTSIGYAVNNTDAASKQYVDTLVSTGISYHQPVNAATTTTLATSTGGTTAYNSPNGAGNGIGAYISTTGSYTTIDDVNIATIGRRILVKDEANATWNGVYTYSNSTAITRATDADEYGSDSTEQISINDYFFTQAGTVNNGTAFVVNSPIGTITFGTSDITFATFSTSQVYTGGTGINVSGTVISANAIQTQVTAVGTLTTLSVSGNSNVGNIGAAAGVFTTVAGTLTTQAQPNITSTGTLTTLSVSGNITSGNLTSTGLTNLGAVGNVTLTGGTSGQVLSTDGSGVLSFATISTSVVSNGTSNVTIPVSNGNVTVTSNGTYTWNFATDGKFYMPSPGIILGVNGSEIIEDGGIGISSNGSTSITSTNETLISANGRQWTFRNDGALSIPDNILFNNNSTIGADGNALAIGGNDGVGVSGGAGNISLITSGLYTWNFDTTGNLTIPMNIYGQNNASMQINVYDNGSSPILELNNYDVANDITHSTVGLFINQVGITAGTSSWTFDNTGNLTIPGSIKGPGNLKLYPNSSNTTSYLDVYQTAGLGPDVHLVANNSNLVLGADNSANVMVNENGNVSIQTWTDGDSNVWTFDYSGNLTLPANTFQINYANGTPVSLGGGSGISNGTSNVSIPVANSNVYINTNSGTAQQWIFGADDGVLTLSNIGYISAPEGTTIDIYTGNATGYSEIALFDNGSANITTLAGTYVWQFDNTGNLSAPGAISATGNGTFGNLFTAGPTGNIGGANVIFANTVIASSGLTSTGLTDLGSVGNVTITGGTSGYVLSTDGSGVLSWVAQSGGGGGSSISNGTSNVNIATSDGNVTTTVAGNTTVTVTDTGTEIIGTLSISGNANVNNISTNGSGGNISGANVITANTFIASANLNSTGLANLGAIGNITITGGSNGQYLRTNGSGVLSFATISTSSVSNGNSNVNIATANGNVTTTAAGNTTLTITGTGANIAGTLSVSGNTLVGNLTTGGVGGNITNANVISANTFIALANFSGNTNGFTIGYLNVPQVAAANATLALTDAGKHYYSTSAGNFTLTIPANNTVAFDTGAEIRVVVQSAGNVLINAASGVTLYKSGNSTAANRYVSGYGVATLLKVAANTWFIDGTGIV